MSWRTLGALVAFLLVCGSVYYLEVYRHQEVRQGESGKKLLSFQKDNVRAIEIIEGEKQIRLARRGEYWFLEKPMESLASADEVNYLLDALLGMEKNEELTPSGALSPVAYGIGPGSSEVRLTLEGGKVVRLWVGKKAPVEYAQYLALGEQSHVFLVNSVLDYTLGKNADEFRERRLFAMGANQPVEVTIRTNDASLTLRKQDGSWRVESPKGPEYDDAEVSLLGTAIEGLKRQEFLDDVAAELKERICSEVKGRIEIVTKEGKKWNLLIGPQEKESHLALLEPGSEAFRLTSYDVSAILKTPVALQKKEVFSVSGKDLQEIRIVRYLPYSKAGNLTFIVRKEGEEYGLLQGGKPHKPAYNLSIFVDNLLGVRARDVLEGKPEAISSVGLDKPDFTVTLITSGGSTTEAALKRTQRDGGTKVFLKVMGKDAYCEVDPFLWDRLDRLTRPVS
jgi:hypothetical protein